MSRWFSRTLFLAVVLLLCLPFISFAQVYPPGQSPDPYPRPSYSYVQDNTGKWYVAVKPGAFFPTGDLDDKGFGTGFAGELTMGNYLTRNLALEAAVGYFQTDASLNTATVSEEDDIWVIPVTATIKGILPIQGGLELSAGAGAGLYFANIRAKGSTAAGHFSNDGSDTAIGGHVVAGLTYNFPRKAFIGVEGKYIFTNKIDLLGSKIHLNGFTLTGVLGIRY